MTTLIDKMPATAWTVTAPKDYGEEGWIATPNGWCNETLIVTPVGPEGDLDRVFLTWVNSKYSQYFTAPQGSILVRFETSDNLQAPPPIFFPRKVT